MKSVWPVVVVSLLAIPMKAQSSKDLARLKPRPAPAPSLQINCAEYDNLASCKTFDEMLRAKDQDILDDLQEGVETFVCFDKPAPESDTDRFYLVDFDMPTSWHQDKPDEDGNPSLNYKGTSWGLRLGVYSNGNRKDFGYGGNLSWEFNVPKGSPLPQAYRTPPEDTNPFGNSSNGNGYTGLRSVYIDNTSVTITTYSTNPDRTRSPEVLAIRRSTGRFELDTTIEGSTITDRGRCAHYLNGRLAR